MYKIIALCGKAGAGKDYNLGQLLKTISNSNEIISCTTRPRRDYEAEGVNYYFLTENDFIKKWNNGEMLETTIFNGWCYGTSLDALNENAINIGVFNPAGIRKILKNKNVDVMVFHIQASDKTRLLRQLNRETAPNVNEIIRRFSTDEEDFKNLNFETYPIWNEDYEDNTQIILDVVAGVWGRDSLIINEKTPYIV